MIRFEKKEDICIVHTGGIVISDVQSALDLIATADYETGCNKIAIEKSAITEDFFDLHTKLAGEILQKFVQYHCRIAIIGDFSVYDSKALRDFIYESNKGHHVYFAKSLDDALDILAK